MTRNERIFKYGPLLFGIPISVLGLLEQWRDWNGDAWLGRLLSIKFAVELSAAIAIGYVGGMAFAWLWDGLMRGTFGWRDRQPP